MSVSTVYPSAGYSWSTNHEYGRSWYNNWNASSADGYGVDYVAKAQVFKGGSNSFDIYRSSLVFDTSGIPANATITAATLNLYRKKEWSQLGYSKYTYVCPVSATGSAAGYYNKAYFGNTIAGWDANGQSDNVDQWVSMSILGSIVKEGNTILGFRHWCDYNNVEPGGSTGTDQTYSEDYRNANKGYLSITWTTPPSTTTGGASNIQGGTADLVCQATSAGGGTISASGVCLSSSNGVPTTSDSVFDDGAHNLSSHTVGVSGLVPNTTYYYRAFVTTENSTQYGSVQTFVTDNTPAVTSTSVTNRSPISAVGNGNVTSDGAGTVSERGFVLGTAANPTTANTKFTSGSGTGAYTTNLTGLIPGKSYHVRAYAINGVGTSYGADIQFTTPSPGIIFLTSM